MKCPGCNKEVSPGEVFCNNCGTFVEGEALGEMGFAESEVSVEGEIYEDDMSLDPSSLGNMPQRYTQEVRQVGAPFKIVIIVLVIILLILIAKRAVDAGLLG